MYCKSLSGQSRLTILFIYNWNKYAQKERNTTSSNGMQRSLETTITIIRPTTGPEVAVILCDFWRF